MNETLKPKQDKDIEAVERLDCETSSDALQLLLHQQRYDFTLVRISAEDAVLEVGTGTGYFSRVLATHCQTYAGLEFDPDACEITRKRLQGRGQLVQGDAQAMPFADSTFSTVVCLEVLEHLQDYRKAVREIVRCLKPDGRAIISVPYRQYGGKNDKNPYHIYEPGEKELAAAFAPYFARVEVSYQHFAETLGMTLARRLHVRRFVGLMPIYRDFANGVPAALERIKIDTQGRGIRIGLLLEASNPHAKK